MDEDKLFEIVRNAYNGVNTDYLKSQVLAAVAEIGLTRQEVMDGLLDWIVVGGCTGANDRYRPYIYGALALLREQEPRVLTVEEIRSGAVEVAWVEDRDKVEVIPGIWFRLSNEGEDEAVDIHIRDGFVGARLAVYGKLWRCWTAWPTLEQMRETKWEGEEIK